MEWDILQNNQKRKDKAVLKNMATVLQRLYANIPDKKRISYGCVCTIAVVSKYVFARPAGIETWCAAASNFDLHEFADVFFRRLAKRYPDEMQKCLFEESAA